MKSRYYLLPLAILCLLSCKAKVESYHIPPAQMGKLLMDIHAAEVYSSLVSKDSLSRGNGKDLDSLSLYYQDIFAHYKITKDQFDESMAWYRKHPSDLDSIYSKMLPELSKQEGNIKAKK